MISRCQLFPQITTPKIAKAGSVTNATVFEEFIQKRFLGAKSFSLEGAESLIPLLELAIEKSGEQGVEEIVLGMAHRVVVLNQGRKTATLDRLAATPEAVMVRSKT